MADLKALFSELNFSKITTYIQSGNVIFDTDGKAEDLALSKRLEKAINERFGFDVPVIIRTANELEQAINQNPFFKGDPDLAHLHLTLLNEEPTPENQLQLQTYNYEPDKFVLDGKDVFIYCAGKYHESKLTNNFFEKKLKVSATTRNWKTVLKLVEISRAAPTPGAPGKGWLS